MIITFISQCEKNALKKTRKVLDSFANRIGDRAWQTVITNEGLIAVRQLLRSSASKNTAVSCHYSGGYARSKLLWIVGNRNKFNSEGVIPIATTKQPIINTEWENDWQYMPLIKSLTAVAALLHDWGKANEYFQAKLKPKSKSRHSQNISDPLRHEWVSCLLLHSFVNAQAHGADDEAWLGALAEGKIDDNKIKLQDLKYFYGLPNAAMLVLWLILTHHRLPLKTDDNCGDITSAEKFFECVTKDWGYHNSLNLESLECLKLRSNLSQSDHWLKALKKWSSRLKDNLELLNKALEDGSWRLILQYSRLSLMLGDHLYSSEDAAKSWEDKTGLFANTDHEKKLKQKLDEHLVGVSSKALNIVHLLPKFETEFEYCYDSAALHKKAKLDQFKWQDRAVDKIKDFTSTLPKGQRTGFFAVNMASTGCGKTLANAKIMQALSDKKDALRFTIALGLRSLTLQTGDEYREKIGLDGSELAVIIGSKAHAELYRSSSGKDQEVQDTEIIGSESLENLFDDDLAFGDFDESSIPEEHFVTLLKSKKHKQLLYAPVVVCTIDHMMGATETMRGGKYILPTLRLMSCDLVIDEIDDFDGSDLIAIGRLIHLVGMLGRKVMISSATIPPALAEGYFNAYKRGWDIFSKSRGVSNSLGCAMIDEFTANVKEIKDKESYKEQQDEFIESRVEKLSKSPIKRKGEIIKCEVGIGEAAYFEIIQESIISNHRRHCRIDDRTKKKISFGLVRMANVDPCIKLARYLTKKSLPDDVDIRLMAYHSKQVLLLRHLQEEHLDAVLKMHKQGHREKSKFKEHYQIIENHIRASEKQNVIFVVVATPIEEVGRDHDFDFAIIEPSSLRSIIQLAGRVMRHRDQLAKLPNISIMQYNLKAIEGKEIAYTRPGYESSGNTLDTKDMNILLEDAKIDESITAIPRIRSNGSLEPKKSFSDLEHEVVRGLLTNYTGIGVKTMQGWFDNVWWMSGMPQHHVKFRNGRSTTEYYLRFDDSEREYRFYEKDLSGSYVAKSQDIELKNSLKSDRFWLNRDYDEAVELMSQRLGVYKTAITERYGVIAIDEYKHYNNTQKPYSYSYQFGLQEK